ncbi:GAP family protein [Mycobacterium heidelbergense]|uniref:Uncharacterized protein n=1 Tax=Mycobacterium heidelbergense TaxID=53376 RepID=A0A1X0DH28_MYCHE|nr:GAP family protein [Mycobacterium heidelbergense]MCV7049814.1 GAP family protein [Mycobacterium heidelbergense]ORA71685.1 hypothetical protein BST25_16080 [Mycobacterium heidelbergense]BBZ52918.1 membrane protein [Mycobacterium heidelbergense]
MWTAVLYIGLVMATDPIRIGLALVLVTRRRPMLNLFAFWLGGVVSGVFLATAVLVLGRDVALPVIRAGVSMLSEVRSSIVILAGGRLQITLGVLALLSVLVISARQRAREKTPVGVGVPVGGVSGAALQPERPGLIARMGARTQNMLTCGGFVWPAFVVGLATSAPPIESVTALTIIMASGANIGAQFSAFLVFILLVLTVIEIPLVGYLAMPQKTEAVMLQLKNWMQAYGRKLTQYTLGVMGVIGVVQGVVAL